MEPWQIYLLLKMDTIQELGFFIFWVGLLGIIGIGLYIGALLDKNCKVPTLVKVHFATAILIFLTGALWTVLVPNTKETTLLLGTPAINTAECGETR